MYEKGKFNENPNEMGFFFSWLWNTQDQFTLPRGHSCWVTLKPESCGDEKVLPLSPRLQHKRDEHVHSHELPTAELTSRSGWVRIIHVVQTFAVTIGRTAGPGLFCSPILRHSTHWARADSASWNGHSPWHQPQSQWVHCYLRLTPSMGALTLSDDCRVTAKPYVRLFFFFLRDIWLWEILLLVVCSWPHAEPERVKSGHAGACGVLRWRDRCETASKTRRTYWEGRPPIAHFLVWRWRRPGISPSALIADRVFWSLGGAPAVFSSYQHKLLNTCDASTLKSWCEVSDGPVVQLCGWHGWGAEAGVRTRPPTVWGHRTHILLRVCHKQCRCNIQLFLPLITQSSIQPSLTGVNIVSSNSTRVQSRAAWRCLSKRVI